MTDNSGDRGSLITLEVITEDHTSLYSQPPDANTFLGMNIPIYIYSAGIGAVVAGIGLSVAFIKRKK